MNQVKPITCILTSIEQGNKKTESLLINGLFICVGRFFVSGNGELKPT